MLDWFRRLGWARWVAATAFGSALTALLPVPLSSVGGWALTTLLLLGIAAGGALIAAGLGRLVARWTARGLDVARLFLVAQAALLTLTAGVLLVNLLVVDAPLGPAARIGYRLTLAAVLVFAGVTALATRSWRNGDRRRAERALALWLAVDALVAGLLDGYCIRPEYPIHGVLLALTTLGFAAAVWFAVPARHARRWAGAGMLPLIAALAIWCGRDHATIVQAVVGARTPHLTALGWARRLTDRDRDGYSPWLEGGDCDDHDARAYPLSPSRDCLDWRRHDQPPRVHAIPATVAATTPQVILLLTLDAFRCGFGRGGPPELRDACPVLTRLATEGRARFDARTHVPTTAPAMATLMTGDPAAGEQSGGRGGLAARLREVGYSSHALMTLPQPLSYPGIRASFDDVDETLAATVISPFRADDLTARVAERVRESLRTPDQHAFIWAHYPDLHFPYIVDDESPWKHSSIADYAQLLRRCDAAIGHLVEALARMPDGDRVLVVITADHGEEFLEHGERYHGFTLYDEALHVPMVAWSPGTHRRYGSDELPAQLADLGAYVMNAADGTPIVYRDQVQLRGVVGEYQVGLIADGWKLIYNKTRQRMQLFDLGSDPRERENRALSRPDIVASLGHQLGSLLDHEEHHTCARHARAQP
jgi:hypothetical protein